MAPQNTTSFKKFLFFVPQSFTLQIKDLECCPYWFAVVDSSSTIFDFNLNSKRRVKTVETMPTHAIMKLRLLISLCTWTVDNLLIPSFVINDNPQIMQKFIPKAGRNRGIEAAYPFWWSGNSFRRPQGAVIMGIWAIAITMVMINAIVQLVPARYRPTEATPVAKVEKTTQGKQFLLKQLNIKGLINMQNILKLLDSNSTQVLFTWQNYSASGSTAKKAPIIMSIVTETVVTDRINPHYNNINYKPNCQQHQQKNNKKKIQAQTQQRYYASDFLYFELLIIYTVLKSYFIYLNGLNLIRLSVQTVDIFIDQYI